MRFLALLCVGAICLAAPAADAYWCTRTDQGASLGWATRTVEMRAQSADSQEISRAQLEDAVDHAGAQWTDAACSDFTFTRGASATEVAVGFDWRAGTGSPDNENIVVFRQGTEGDDVDAWMHPVTAIGITTVTFLRSTGQILDADVELNDDGFVFSACDDCQARHDLKNTLTHELGHVVGLDHPPSFQAGAPSATMYASAPAGDLDKRDLAQDDVDGVCTLYPSGDTLGQCGDIVLPPAPSVRVEAAGCAAGGSGGSAPLVGLLAAIFALASIRARRSRTGEQPGKPVI
jgi:predicted Zn-dependent protease